MIKQIVAWKAGYVVFTSIAWLAGIIGIMFFYASRYEAVLASFGTGPGTMPAFQTRLIAAFMVFAIFQTTAVHIGLYSIPRGVDAITMLIEISIRIVLRPLGILPWILSRPYDAEIAGKTLSVIRSGNFSEEDLDLIQESAEAALNSMEARGIPLAVLLTVIGIIIAAPDLFGPIYRWGTEIMVKVSEGLVLVETASPEGELLELILTIAIDVFSNIVMFIMVFYGIMIFGSVVSIPYQSALHSSILQAVALEKRSRRGPSNQVIENDKKAQQRNSFIRKRTITRWFLGFKVSEVVEDYFEEE